MTSNAARRLAGPRRRDPVHTTSAPPPGTSRANPGSAAGHGCPSAATAGANGAPRSGAPRRDGDPAGEWCRGHPLRPGHDRAPAVVGGEREVPRAHLRAQLGRGGQRLARPRLGQVDARAVHLVAPGHQHAAGGRDRRVGDRHPAAGIDVLGGAERARAHRSVQLQPVARAQRHVLRAVDQRRRSARADDRPGSVARVGGQPPGPAEALPGAPQRRPHGGARRRAPRRDGVAALPDRDGHAGAARAPHEGGERLGRAEPGGAGLAGRRLQAPAPRAAVSEPHDDGRAAGRKGRRRVGARAAPGDRYRPSHPAARAEGGDAHAAAPSMDALHDDHAAAVGGDPGVDGAIGAAGVHQRRGTGRRAARAGRAPRTPPTASPSRAGRSGSPRRRARRGRPRRRRWIRRGAMTVRGGLRKAKRARSDDERRRHSPPTPPTHRHA